MDTSETAPLCNRSGNVLESSAHWRFQSDDRLPPREKLSLRLAAEPKCDMAIKGHFKSGL